MKTILKYFLFVLPISMLFGCCENDNSDNSGTSNNTHSVAILTEYRTNQYFTDDLIPVEDITTILEAGRNTPSGLNKQRWFFSALINQDTIAAIAEKLPKRKAPPTHDKSDKHESVTIRGKAQFGDAPAVIIMSCDENQKFATGLASEAMLIASEKLGYGTKIMAGVAKHLNSTEIHKTLKVPEGMQVVAILVIGKKDTTIDYSADGITGASTRKAMEEVAVIIQ